MSSIQPNQWLVGYGTFITKGTWKNYPSCRVCKVPGLRRMYDPKMAWFPFAIDDEETEMLAVCFLVDEDSLEAFDRYEGVGQGLNERVKREVLVKEEDGIWISREAWIYLPTSSTMENPLFPWEDSDDRWLRENIQELVELHASFPEFFGPKAEG
ncbi:MAG: gamma-glutamylcyclotransferase family protein [Candidatus Thorarchaeota archaeon]